MMEYTYLFPLTSQSVKTVPSTPTVIPPKSRTQVPQPPVCRIAELLIRFA